MHSDYSTLHISLIPNLLFSMCGTNSMNLGEDRKKLKTDKDIELTGMLTYLSHRVKIRQ